MAFNGVEVISVGIKHTVGNFTLYPKAGEASTFEVGGLMAEDDTGGVTASGEAIYKHSMKRWKVEVAPTSWDRGVNDTLFDLRKVVESFEEATFVFNLADGVIYQGKGRIVGDLKGSAFEANIPVIFSGGGKLEKI